MIRALHKFHGGIHPADNKSLTRSEPVLPGPVPPEVIISLNQGIGAVNRPLVSVGDKVKKGERLSECFHPLSAPVHAPCSGVVTAIEMRPFTHPSGMDNLAIVIKSESDNNADPVATDTVDLKQILNNLSAEEIVTRIRMAGVIGLGGAGFPTSTKIRTGTKSSIRTLIINGMECEPYITCDDRLMQESADEIIHGIEVIDHLLQPQEIMVGVEDNKPEAIMAMKTAAAASSASIDVVTIPTLYPSGGEKQLIKILTGREVPSGGYPNDLSVLSQNVATAQAIYHAILEQPLTHRLVTVTGNGIAKPGNYKVAIGTPIKTLLDSCFINDEPVEITVGGPMMGCKLQTADSPIIKTVNCLIVQKSSALPTPPEIRNCIRCAACSDACPASLLPQQLYWASQSRDFDKTGELHIFDCIECGCCNHVCPSNIPLVDYYRHAKGVLRTQQREKGKSEEARKRHEFRDARLLREKEEKAKKLAAKRAALKAKKNKDSEKSGDDSTKKEAIRAAIERAKAKKMANSASAKASNEDGADDDQD